MYTGRTPCEDEGRDQGAASKSQGVPNIASQPPEARGEIWIIFFLNLQKKPALLTEDLDFGL